MVEMTIHRKWFFVHKNGKLLLDWGQGKAQEVLSGQFISYVPKDYVHAVKDEMLVGLMETGKVIRFDQEQVVIRS